MSLNLSIDFHYFEISIFAMAACQLFFFKLQIFNDLFLLNNLFFFASDHFLVLPLHLSIILIVSQWFFILQVNLIIQTSQLIAPLFSSIMPFTTGSHSNNELIIFALILDLLIQLNMNQSQIEEIAHTILQSQTFRTQLIQLLQEFQYRHSDVSSTLPLNSVIEEVTQCLADITEAALEEDNSHNYITFMKKSQQLYAERQAKMTAQLSKQIEQLKNQFSDKIKALKDYVPAKRQINPLKTERMNITKTIIDNHRSLNLSSKFSIIPNNKENYKEDQYLNQISTSQQTASCIQRLSEYDKGFERMNQIVDQMARKIQDLNQNIKDKQDTTDSGFNGVWNIISDLQSKISRLEPLLSLVQACS